MGVAFSMFFHYLKIRPLSTISASGSFWILLILLIIQDKKKSSSLPQTVLGPIQLDPRKQELSMLFDRNQDVKRIFQLMGFSSLSS